MKIFVLGLFLVFSVLASDFPKSFAQLGTPLYKSLKPISQYKDVSLLHTEIQKYENIVEETKKKGFLVDSTHDKKEMKEYLFALRKLQKEYDYLLHLLHKSINKAIDDKDYKLFIALTNYEFDGLLQNSNLRNKAINFYKKNRSQKHSKFLEKKINRNHLQEATTEEFFNQAKEFTYSSKVDSSSAQRSVSIMFGRDKDKIFVDFKNKNPYDVTIDVEPMYQNIQEKEGTKRVIVLKANSVKRYTTLSLGNGEISYAFRYRWIIGNKDAIHEDAYLYRLPFAKKTSHRVSQGFNGKSTHKGHSQYAVDFAMPEHTKIYAARNGVVVRTKSDSNKGGFVKELAKYGNFVTIEHSDGTFANYYHLQQNGVLVKVGEIVQRGEPIGYSGNTGYTSGPHLHFAVFHATKEIKTQTIPIRFVSTTGVDTEPIVGASYTAK